MQNKRTVCAWILAVALMVVPMLAGASIHAGSNIQSADGGNPIPPPPGSGNGYVVAPSQWLDGGNPIPPPPGSGSIA